MKNIIYIITLVLVFSCKAQKNTQEIIIGTYETKTEGVFGKVVLNKDSSFLYQYNAGLIKTESKGNWKLINGDLILKSDEEYLTNQIQVKEYSDMLMQKVEQNNCNVYLINTGMDRNGRRYPLEYTRQCIKDAIQKGSSDESEIVLGILEGLINA